MGKILSSPNRILTLSEIQNIIRRLLRFLSGFFFILCVQNDLSSLCHDDPCEVASGLYYVLVVSLDVFHILYIQTKKPILSDWLSPIKPHESMSVQYTIDLVFIKIFHNGLQKSNGRRESAVRFFRVIMLHSIQNRCSWDCH